MNCPACQTYNPSSALTCINCGADLQTRCAKCQAILPWNAHFCMNCGQPVDEFRAVDENRLSQLAAAAPAVVAEKLLTTPMLGESRPVTAMFVDVVGFRALTEQLGSESIADEIVAEAFHRFTPILYEYEGTLARLYCDTLLAFFGAPLAHEDDPLRAVYAAQDILEACTLYAAELRATSSINFKVRIGISTGPVIIESVDQNLTYSYQAVGTTINLASRIQAPAPPMSITLAGNTYRLVQDAFECQPGESLFLEGFEHPEMVYRVLRALPQPNIRRMAGMESNLIGREQELETLLGLSETVRLGLGRAVLLLGEPGIGKTRLVNEWRLISERTAAESGLQWAKGRCSSYEQTTAYALVRDLLHALLNVPPDAADDETEAALRTVCDGLPNQPGEIFPFLAHLLDLPLSTAEYQRLPVLDPPAMQAQYLGAMRFLLRHLAESKPMILILEDLHWADPSSVELFSKLLPVAVSSPILFSLVTRQERDTPGWKLVMAARETLGDSLTEIHLDPLTEAESNELVNNLLNIDSLPKHLRLMILRKSEGNPFFVEEVVRMLISRGALHQDGSTWSSDLPSAHMDVPDTLQGLLTARIDRLPPEARYVLRVASVIGRQFSLRLLDQLLQGRPLSREISQLENSGVIRVAQVRPELAYIFRHALIYEAAYASLLPEDRRRLHLAVGQIIEDLHPNASPDVAARLGQHFAQAGERTRAIRYFMQAGQAARLAYANQEAAGMFRQALALAEDEKLKAELLSNLGESLFEQNRFGSAIEIWQEAISLWQRLGQEDSVALLTARCARVYWYLGDPPAALRLCLDGLAALQLDHEDSLREGPGFAALLHETARAYIFSGQPEAGRPMAKRALKMAEKIGDVEVQADALATLGILHTTGAEEALSALRRSVNLAESAGLLRTASRAMVNLGATIINRKGDLRTAREVFKHAAELHRRRGALSDEVLTLISIADVSFSLGEIHFTESILKTISQRMEWLSDRGQTEITLRIFLATAGIGRGEWQRVVPELRNLRSECRSRGELQSLSNVCRALGWGLLEMQSYGLPSDMAEAEDAFREAMHVADKGLSYSVSLYALAAMLALQQNNLPLAKDRLETARQRAGKQPIPLEESWILWTQALVQAADQQFPAAFQAFEQAGRLVQGVGLRIHWVRILDSWAQVHLQRGLPIDLEQAQYLMRQALDLTRELELNELARMLDKKLRSLQVRALAQARAHQAVNQELAMAGRIQEGFLPGVLPDLPGWQAAAALRPARQTSGDFYDFIPLPGERFGVLVADVADKGIGAAIVMALSRTLVRTFAAQYPDNPSQVMHAVNRRILQDSQSGLFVTLFYGILQPATGRLIYANAGHNPPYLWPAAPPHMLQSLARTGGPLGVLPENTWDVEVRHLAPGDVLLLYTDGLTEAQNQDGDFYGEERLQGALQEATHTQRTAQAVLDQILEDVHAFCDDVEPSDDLTTVVLRRT